MPMLHFDLDELFEDLIPEEKSKKQNSTDTTHKDKFSRNGREVPQAQKTRGFATLPNNSTESTHSTKLVEKHTLEDHLSDLTEEEEALIDSLLSWVSTCLPGEEWTMPLDWLPDSDELRVAAEEEVRKRNPALRIWRTGKDKLVCKVWLGAEPPPYRRPPSKNRLRSSNTKRIQTMWSEEHGWCSWDSESEDYLPNPTLN
jgi:hypothetical protein